LARNFWAICRTALPGSAPPYGIAAQKSDLDYFNGYLLILKHELANQNLCLGGWKYNLWQRVRSRAEQHKRNAPTIGRSAGGVQTGELASLEPGEYALNVEFGGRRVVIELAPECAPRHVSNVKRLWHLTGALRETSFPAMGSLGVLNPAGQLRFSRQFGVATTCRTLLSSDIARILCRKRLTLETCRGANSGASSMTTRRPPNSRKAYFSGSSDPPIPRFGRRQTSAWSEVALVLLRGAERTRCTRL